MRETLRIRLRIIAAGLTVISAILIVQLLSFQFRLDPEVASRLQNQSAGFDGQEVEFRPNRGEILDRDGEVLAVNTVEYRIGISPGAVGTDKRQVAKDLAKALNANELEIYQRLLPDPDTGLYPIYVPLTDSPVSIAMGQAVDELDIPGVVIETVPLRDYPQGELTANIVGFVNYNGRGYWGIEEHYNSELAGQSLIGIESNIPLDVSEGVQLRNGQNIQLTIDRDIQWIAQQTLIEAVEQYEAKGGHILIMNPKTGEILAMVSYPILSIDEYNKLEGERPQFNGNISFSYEPGSIFKIITAAIALDINKPGLDLNWTYNDLGCEIIGGANICTSTQQPTGTKTFAECLIFSLNTCTAHWNEEIGTSLWYDYLRRFGFGTPTGIDLAGEANGIVHWYNTPDWNTTNFLQTSFGQGLSVTPIQMLTAANVIANGGKLMQPYIVQRRFDGENAYEARPTAIDRPVSSETADAILQILIDVVKGEYGNKAEVINYLVAGKTGTAQKVEPDYRYSDTKSYASFIGFLPAEDPQISVLIILDEPPLPTYYWGSQSAAPTFALLAERLVVLLEIPEDTTRYDLERAGGHPFDRE